VLLPPAGPEPLPRILQQGPEVVQLFYTRGQSGERERETFNLCSGQVFIKPTHPAMSRITVHDDVTNRGRRYKIDNSFNEEKNYNPMMHFE